MPQLDPMLRALLQHRARELLLCADRRPAFRFPDGDRPVSKAVLSRAQVLHLVGELADPDHRSSLAAGASGRFEYTAGDGTRYRCHVEWVDGELQARIAPAGAVEPDTAPPVTAPERPGAASPAAGPEAEAPELESGRPALDRYLLAMVRMGGSDLHLSAGEVPRIRLDGEMQPLPDAPVCTPERTAELIGEILPPSNRREFDETHDTDFGYEIPGVARFRMNVFMDRCGPGAVCRVIPTKIPTFEDLNLPDVLREVCNLTKGLVLVTGPTGSGKSTTLAALIDTINRNRAQHIITIEDPIEFVHRNQRCLINQREVGSHTESFKRALRAALREDPDIVLVGEMRDLETIAIALETAETGHLVFGTLHTTTAPSTVDRIIDQFPADRQAQVRTMLSESLKAVVAQTLLKKAGGGRVAAFEILLGIPAIANLIREGKTFQIPSIMQTGKKHGMRLLNDSLVELVRTKQVEPLEAYRKAVDKSGLLGQFRGMGIQLDVQGD